MCAKHAACRSTKVDIQNQPAASSCGSPKITSITAASTPSSSCCATTESSAGGESCCGSDSGEEDRLSSVVELQSKLTKSWLVSGMDCPACARKVEKAVSAIPGVAEAKVLFATEKLVVKYDQVELTETIETTVQKTGFSLNEVGAKKKQEPTTFWQSHIQPNLQIIAIAAAMLFAALIKDFSPVLSERLFIVTCLLGFTLSLNKR